MKNSNNISKKLFYTLILLLIASQLILIKKIIYTKTALNSINNVDEKKHSSTKLIGENLPFYDLVKANHYFEAKLKFVILFLFSIYDCNSCISSMIPSLNDYSTIYRQYGCILYGIVETKGRDIRPFKETLNIQFPLIKNENLRSFIKERGNLKTPIFIFGNIKSKKCIYAYSPDESDAGITNFSKFLEVFFESIGEKDSL